MRLFLSFLDSAGRCLRPAANRRAGHAGAAQRQDRHRRRRECPKRRRSPIRGDRIVAVGSNDDIQRLHRARHAGDRSRRPARDSRAHREPRPLHGLRPVEDDARPDGREGLERDRRRWSRRRRSRRSRASGFSAAAGTRRSGRSVPKPNVEGFPFHDELSKVSPNNPVMLTHASGHASFVNAKAMEAAGLTAKTPDPAGGEILKDTTGRPIGLLRETASGIVGRALEAWRAKKTPEERLRRCAPADRAGGARPASKKASPVFHDAGANFDDDRHLQAGGGRTASSAFACG